jgi:hypothetical protein
MWSVKYSEGVLLFSELQFARKIINYRLKKRLIDILKFAILQSILNSSAYQDKQPS